MLCDKILIGYLVCDDFTCVKVVVVVDICCVQSRGFDEMVVDELEGFAVWCVLR